MIHFQVRHLMGVLECHQLIAIPITTGKKKDRVICPLLRYSNYDRKKRYSCLAIIRCAVPIAIVALFQLRPEIKRYSRLSVVTPFQIPLEKKQKYGGCSIVITTEKKSSSRLSGGCMIVITTGKKN